MELLHLLFAFLLGAAFVLAGLLFLPKLIDRHFKSEKKVYEVVFRTIYYQQPSMFSNIAKGTLIKSPVITVKIKAKNEQNALCMLDDIIKQETKGELVKIKDITDEKKTDRQN